MVAVRAETLRFVIAAAASGLDPAEVEIYSVENHVGVSRPPQDQRAEAQRFVRELVGAAYRDNSRAGLDAMARRLAGRPWFFEPPPREASYWGRCC